MTPRRFLALCLADAGLALAFERSRAASFAQALRAWLGSQVRRLQRCLRIGLSPFAGLLQAEAACAAAGLNYPSEDDGQTAPWHLPERFWSIAPGALPHHPVIDPKVLAASQLAGSEPNAAQALQALALAGAGSTHWRGLPMLANNAPSATSGGKVAVALHLFYPELWPLLWAQCRLIPEPWDLFVTVPAFAATTAWKDIVRDHPSVRFLPVVNRGRDVAPWLQLLRTGELNRYEAVCKLHGKRSPHTTGGDAWRDELVGTLLGNAANIQSILNRFRDQPELALLGPAASERPMQVGTDWSKNRRYVELLSDRLGLGNISADQQFFAGTMFWFRPAAFETLKKLGPVLADFPLEMGQTEGTLAHAVERLVGVAAGVGSAAVSAWPARPSR